MTSDNCDLAIVGGGLAGGLIALAAARARPDARVLLIEAGERLGGNHIWSFFKSDLAPRELSLLAPLVSHGWEGYDVRFPGLRRTLRTGYLSIRSERFDGVLRERLPAASILCGTAVRDVEPTSVMLADGRGIAAGGVIDARGAADISMLDAGWQKFVGHELRLAAPHGLDRPVVMDALVPQRDGYRFVYLLPFAADRVFVEDTYYSDTAELDERAIAARIAGYAEARGWEIAEVVHRESGALPVVMAGDFARFWGGDGVANAGVRAGLFHPTTGYSLPDAARTALLVAGLADWSGAALHDALHDHARREWEARGFYRLLARLLFRAAEPGERWRVMRRFYGLDPALIGRFYAARSTLADKARTLAGWPPVPITRALAVLAVRKRAA